MKELGLAIVITAIIAISVPAVYSASGAGGAKDVPERPPDVERPGGGGGAGPTGPALEGPALLGQQVATQNGCVGCHSTGGADGIGPTWKGLFGHEVTLTDGSTVTADEAYLEESIVDPNAQVVEGFQPNIMPQTFGNTLTDEQITGLIEYIKTIQ